MSSIKDNKSDIAFVLAWSVEPRFDKPVSNVLKISLNTFSCSLLISLEKADKASLTTATEKSKLLSCANHVENKCSYEMKYPKFCWIYFTVSFSLSTRYSFISSLVIPSFFEKFFNKYISINIKTYVF